MSYKEKDSRDLLTLVRLGIGHDVNRLPENVNWDAIIDLSNKQGLTAIVIDGVDRIPLDERPNKIYLLQWIGEVMMGESQFERQRKAAIEMAALFQRNHIKTFVLKGFVISECYPCPSHRVSVDMDCFLLPEKGDFNAWKRGNEIIKASGYEVEDDFYKHSKYNLPGLTVENHQFMTAFRCNKRLKRLEILLQGMLKSDNDGGRLFESDLLRPPVMVSALFIIEHAYTHFLNEGLSWRHVLDWMLFKEKHKDELDWEAFNSYIEEFGFRKFYDSYFRLGRYFLGEIAGDGMTPRDKLMLEDVWNDYDVVEDDRNLMGKIALATKLFRSRWKYHYFSEISAFHALWIYVIGYLFVKNPRL